MGEPTCEIACPEGVCRLCQQELQEADLEGIRVD